MFLIEAIEIKGIGAFVLVPVNFHFTISENENVLFQLIFFSFVLK